MADQPTTPSGSRWEPDPDQTTETDQTPDNAAPDTRAEQTGEAQPPAPAAATDPYGVAPALPADPAADERRAQLRSRAVLAGAATALVLGGGLTGFVIGHATAGDDRVGFQPANFSGQAPGGQLGEGQQGPPSFRGDGDGDRDGDGFGPPPGSGSGSSSGTTSGSGTSGTGT